VSDPVDQSHELVEALEINGVSQTDQDTILGLDYGLTGDIVRS